MTEKSKGASLETWYYTYDNESHLTVVRQTANGTTNELLVTYTYDVYGLRIEEQKWQSSPGTTVTTEFVWSGTQVVMDFNGSNVVQERYLWGDTQDQLFARVDGNGTAGWYLTDRLGSVRDELNASGVSQDHVDYSAFGSITYESNGSARGRYGWTAREYDSQTGLQYNRARYYTPATGTWTSEDPSGFGAGDTNLYRYVQGRSVNAIDPMGLAPTKVTVNQVAAPYTANYGVFAWFVTFSLDAPADAANGGEIVQEVTADFWRGSATGWDAFATRATHQHTHYLEAWTVPPGKNGPGGHPLAKKDLTAMRLAFAGFPANVNFDDAYWNLVGGARIGGPGSKGKIIITGDVYYINNSSGSPFLKAQGKEGSFAGAGNLQSLNLIQARGAFRSDPGDDPYAPPPEKTIANYVPDRRLIGPTKHTLTATWDDTAKAPGTNPTTTVTHVP